MCELSILIPARQEEFLKHTIDNLLRNLRGDTEIIVVLDGAWADPPIPQHERVTIVYHPVPRGQRAACNEAANLARGRYVMKLDAHCTIDEGLDLKMVDAFRAEGDDVTMVPAMYNLWAFDWLCGKCGKRTYQGRKPTSCGSCDNTAEFIREITFTHEATRGTTAFANWKRSRSALSTSYCFDSEPHFQYFGEYAKRPEAQGDLAPTMSLQGSCFACSKERFTALNLCDEAFGSWGSQGIEVACKTWLSGGRVLCNKRTWYAHLFRTQGGDFGFPYPLSSSQVKHAKMGVRELFFENKWPQQKYPLHWLVEKFWPVKGWSLEDLEHLKSLAERPSDREAEAIPTNHSI